MNNTQRILLVIYLPITLLILILDNIYPKENMVLYLKYTIMITLFLSAITMQKKIREQKIMALSFFFLVVADFFLVFINTIDNLKLNFSALGVIGFLFAYICLIVAYQKNFKVGKEEIIVAIPIGIIFIYVFISLQPYVKGGMFIGALIFLIVLCYMTWTSICTIFRGYFTKKSALLIAISGILMFICDIGVAFSRFHSIYSKMYVPWLANIIWTTYIPGWTLLVVVICEKNLIIGMQDK
ncbi:hypothetical protein psyc5s11_28740 [Clostridium gelidum]|uniref:YhhN-like protein n=1 Tax=Clostridium gelidum TaxID=704125 RepID=A0ABN6IXF9_9CLOT|nr:lysoplasmalogenase family protein [Clostridium gelidum]BCZ46807.1 hypothetical protein psyc5s11_28740 [Clostridium gelidum]